MFLKMLTYPYVTSLYEVKETNESIESPDRLFLAKRLNLFGFEYDTKFHLSETERVTSATVHPFASFRVKGSYFYVFGANISDKKIRQSLTNES